MIARLRQYLLRRKYRDGAQLTQFVSRDVRRDVEIVDASELTGEPWGGPVPESDISRPPPHD